MLFRSTNADADVAVVCNSMQDVPIEPASEGANLWAHPCHQLVERSCPNLFPVSAIHDRSNSTPPADGIGDTTGCHPTSCVGPSGDTSPGNHSLEECTIGASGGAEADVNVSDTGVCPPSRRLHEQASTDLLLLPCALLPPSPTVFLFWPM